VIRVYLDNCCLNRPFDDQSQLTVRLETEAKLPVQELVVENVLSLVWSFVLDYENAMNIDDTVKAQIALWRNIASVRCGLDEAVKTKARNLMKLGLKQMDAAHIACAIRGKADFFLTVDKRILNKQIDGVSAINPIDFVRRISE